MVRNHNMISFDNRKDIAGVALIVIAAIVNLYIGASIALDFTGSMDGSPLPFFFAAAMFCIALLIAVIYRK